MFERYGLNKEDVETLFEKKKTLKDIIELCALVENISTRLSISPVFDKDTVNATSIMKKLGFLDDMDSFINILVEM